jgi:glutamine amidotransferase
VCRHLAWLGPPRPLSALLFDPPHSLYRQSWAPRRQRHGTINADGYGVGWYAAGRSEPVQFRRAQPIWSDRSFASLAPTVSSGCVVAAVRSATPPQPVEESCAAPFLLSGGGLFSHNGAVDPAAIAAVLPSSARAETLMDSALLAALVSSLLESGTPLPDALAETTLRVRTGRLNLLATNGQIVAATTWGDTLSWIRRDGGVLVSSEPDDDDPAWVDVPDLSLLTVSPSLTVDIRPLEAA